VSCTSRVRAGVRLGLGLGILPRGTGTRTFRVQVLTCKRFQDGQGPAERTGYADSDTELFTAAATAPGRRQQPRRFKCSRRSVAAAARRLGHPTDPPLTYRWLTLRTRRASTEAVHVARPSPADPVPVLGPARGPISGCPSLPADPARVLSQPAAAQAEPPGRPGIVEPESGPGAAAQRLHPPGPGRAPQALRLESGYCRSVAAAATACASQRRASAERLRRTVLTELHATPLEANLAAAGDKTLALGVSPAGACGGRGCLQQSMSSST
jgi:hypothetical protein